MQLPTLKKLLISVAITSSLMACQATEETTSAQPTSVEQQQNKLTLDRIYKDYEFRSDYIGQIRWLEDGSGYTAVEKSKTTKAKRAPRPAKYKYVDATGNEKTWTGQGRTPSAIQEQLDAGKSLEEFAL